MRRGRLIIIIFLTLYSPSIIGKSRQENQPLKMVYEYTPEIDFRIDDQIQDFEPFITPLIDQLFFLYSNLYGRVKGDSCLFYPTCSQYSRLCIKEYGFVSGLWMTGGRLIRAHVNFNNFYEKKTMPEGVRFVDLPEQERFEYYTSLDKEDSRYAVSSPN